MTQNKLWNSARLILITLFAFTVETAFAQFTLEECYEKSKSNYPQIKQLDWIEKSAGYSLSNAEKAYLPQFNITARATYQSDVTSIPITIPGVKGLSKDQYQAVLEVTQTIWDGGVTSTQKKIIQANSNVEKQKLEVDLYTLKDRVNQLYFSLLLLNEQLVQNEILQNELQNNFNKVTAFQKNGVANEADLDAVRLEQMNSKQRRIELLSTRKAYREMLSILIGEKIPEDVTLVKPVLTMEMVSTSSLNRPEIKLFENQISSLENQSQLILSANRPKFGLFLQSGFGRPGLNMLNNSFSDYYIGGIRLSWNLSGFYTQKNNLSNLKVSKEQVSIQRESFLFNNNLKITQQSNEVEKLRALIESDDEIVRLHTNLKNASSVKVANGVQTVTDLLREINAESMSKQQKSVHEIQLIMALYQLKNQTNN